jgi:predicted DCC family thiol-disulfide oxidoreductase YuxK
VGDAPALIIYDGECPFCRNYVRLLRLREAIGQVELVDARSGDPRVSEFQRQGFNLDKGMLFVHEGRVHHGSDAVHVLAGLTNPEKSVFNRINAKVFSSRTASVLFYPLLRLGRRIALLARGKGSIPHHR